MARRRVVGNEPKGDVGEYSTISVKNIICNISREIKDFTKKRLPEEERYCLVCRNFSNPSNNPILDHVESEIHYLFSCAAYRAERDEWLSKLTLPPDFDLMPTDWKLKVALNDPLNVKLTSKFITNAYNIRSKILNQKQTNIP